MEKRIEDLEARIAFQDEAIDALNNQQHTQQQAIDQLKREITRLKQLLQQATAGSGMEVIDEPPPHY